MAYLETARVLFGLDDERERHPRQRSVTASAAPRSRRNSDDVRLATRGSDLALTQSRSMAARIEAELGVDVELIP